MAQVLGALNMQDNDYINLADPFKEVLFEAVQDYTNRAQAEFDRQASMLVDSTVEKPEYIEKLPGTGGMQDLGQDPQVEPKVVKVTGEWEVAFPLSGWGDAIAISKVAGAYMTVAELDKSILGVVNNSIETEGQAIRKAIFNNVNYTFTDQNHGALTIRRLANTDGSLYPPKVATTDPADQNMYLVSGYTAANISDTNDPFPTIATPFQENFGRTLGGERLITFIHKDQLSVVSLLSDFIETSDSAINDGIGVSKLTNLPTGFPGTLVGRMRGTSWVSVWDYMPTGYMLTVHMDQDKPLKRRVHPSAQSLPSGLTMEVAPPVWNMQKMIWTTFYGYGCANRINAVVMELTTDGSYSIPSGYS